MSWLPRAIASTHPLNHGHSTHWYSSLHVGTLLFSVSPPESTSVSPRPFASLR